MQASARMEGRTAYVTGGASGLGLGAALALQQAGAAVALLDRNAKLGAEAAAELAANGGRVEFVECDVGSRDSVTAAFAAAAEAVGEPDALVSNAGVREIDDFLSLEPEDWERVIDVDLNGVFHCGQVAARSMARRDGGAIVNVASCAGLAAVPGRPAYSTAKAGVIGMTRAMAHELGPHGIRTNVVCPSVIRTPLTEAYFDDEGFSEGMKTLIPLGRAGEPADVADVIVFLLSDEARYVNGSVVSVDGGFIAGKGFQSSQSKDTPYAAPQQVG
jgi:3-oxoacyl-[acyl-carrier protein] reductase